MPTYTLTTGEAFDTIILPKGTVLFRGFDPNNEWVAPFAELFGWPTDIGDQGVEYCVDPLTNVFFYPAPYVADIVNRFPVHVVYITNYDIELISMINPSRSVRDVSSHTIRSPYVQCNTFGGHNMCKRQYRKSDPCLTPTIIGEFPNILGYIAMTKNDGPRYGAGFYSTLLKDMPEAAKQTLPFVAENARGIQGIPEIVLYPYHIRTGMHPRYVHNRAFNDYNAVSYAIKNRAELNYFPLLYATDSRLYTFNELRNSSTLIELTSATFSEEPHRPLYSHLYNFLQQALSRYGVFIGNTRYLFSIDFRTGYYIAKTDIASLDDTPVEEGNLHTFRLHDSQEFRPDQALTIPFAYPAHLKTKIHGWLVRSNANGGISEDSISRTLNAHKASFSRHYMFKKDHPRRFSVKYQLESVFPRPEFNMSHLRSTQKRTSTRTRLTRRKM